MLRLRQQHDVGSAQPVSVANVHCRALQSKEGLSKLKGSLRTHGYFTADVTLGASGRTSSDKQRASLVVDTGSHLTHLACSGCSGCKHHTHYPYVPPARSAVDCNSKLCFTSRCLRFKKSKHCSFWIRYEERSESSGTLVLDNILLGSLYAENITLGCATSQTGLLREQRADGILGLGPGRGSLVNQLGIHRRFALCLGGLTGGGALMFGQDAIARGFSTAAAARSMSQPLLEGVKWSAAKRWLMRNRHGAVNENSTRATGCVENDSKEHYALALDALSLKGTKQQLDMPTVRAALRPGAIIDSGATQSEYDSWR